jgi:hypothetical protein
VLNFFYLELDENRWLSFDCSPGRYTDVCCGSRDEAVTRECSSISAKA